MKKVSSALKNALIQHCIKDELNYRLAALILLSNEDVDTLYTLFVAAHVSFDAWSTALLLQKIWPQQNLRIPSCIF